MAALYSFRFYKYLYLSYFSWDFDQVCRITNILFENSKRKVLKICELFYASITDDTCKCLNHGAIFLAEKHSNEKCDRQTARQTDQQSKG